MATIGDLFIRVTAKDQNFHRSMSKVQRSVRNVTGNVAKMAGTFGATLSIGAALAATLKAVATYSGEYAAAMARVEVGMTRFWLAVGKNLGPVFAKLVDDARVFFGEFVGLDAVVSVLKVIAEVADVVRVTFKAIAYLIGETIAVAQRALAFLNPIIGFMRMQNKQNRGALGMGINPQQLQTMQSGGPQNFGGGTQAIPIVGNNAAVERVGLELRTLGKIMVRKLGGFF